MTDYNNVRTGNEFKSVSLRKDFFIPFSVPFLPSVYSTCTCSLEISPMNYRNGLTNGSEMFFWHPFETILSINAPSKIISEFAANKSTVKSIEGSFHIVQQNNIFIGSTHLVGVVT